MYDVVFVLTTALVGFVFSYIVVTVFNIGGQNDASLGRDVQQMIMQITSSLVDTVFLPIRGSVDIATDTSMMLVTRVKWVIAFTFVIIAALLMHFYHYEILSILDSGWTCTIVPILRNIITPMLQFSRILYAIGAPIVNAYLVAVAQILEAWYVTVAQCSHVNLFRIFSESGLALVTGTTSIKNWFGMNGKVNEQNNFYYNDFDISAPVNHTMRSVAIAEDALSCACKRFEPLFNILFLVFKEPHVVAMIDNGWQTAVRAFQMVFRLLLGDFPQPFLISFKAERALVEFGLAVDAILFKALGEMVKLFDPEFKLTVYPEEAFVTIGTKLWAAWWHYIATVVVNGPLHVLGFFKSDITPFDPQQWSLEKSLSYVQSATYSSAVLIQWIFYVLERLMTDTLAIGDVFSSPETPLQLQCDWAKDVADHRYVSLGYTAGCAVYNAGIAWASLWYIAWGFSVELLTKSVFTHEPQNVFRTMQRWEGPMLPRNKVYTCLDRQESTAYNYVSDHHNANGWIWTQDLSQCNCDRYYGTTPDEDQKYYSPWCGQVSLNFDVFAPLDALIMHVSHGVLGPGFGDAFPFVDPIRNIEINIPQFGIEKSIALPFALPPLTRSAVESVRVLTRVALSYGDILTGHFFNYPTNCGHGLNMLQLQKKYEIEHGKSSVNVPDEEMRWSVCEKRKYSSIRRYDSNAKRFVTESKPICDTSNENDDCMCSYLQPLKPGSKCSCIARYPDLDVTASSQQVGDLIEKRFTSEDVAIHWCNSMIIEWTFQNAAAFADALDYIVSLGPLNPTCDVVDRITKGEGFSNAADNRAGSTYLIADTPTLDLAGEFTSATTKLNNIKNLYSSTSNGCTVKPASYVDATDENGDLIYEEDGSVKQVLAKAEWSCDASETFDSIAKIDPVDLDKSPGCRIWGRTDFFCSAGLFVRNYKRLSMNMARQVVNNGISLMAGNFADVNLQTLPRLCDYERLFGSLSSMISGIIPRISKELKQAFAKYINMVLQVVFVQSVRVTLTLSNMVTTMVMDFVKGSITKDTVSETFNRGVKTILKGQFWAFRYFWETTGEMLDAIAPGAGDVCDIILEITDIITEQLEQGLLDVVNLGLETFFQFVAAVSGDTSVIGDFFSNAFKLWAKIQLLLIEQMWKILAKIFEFFGPVGIFFELMASVVCNALNFVFGVIDGFVRGACFGLCDGIGWTPMKCVDMKATVGNHTSGHLGKHFLRSADDKHLPRKVAETFSWNGTTVCDHFMTAAADYAYTDLRPLERAKWVECVEMKYIGVEIAKFVGSNSFPTDIMYNWKTKYVLMYDIARAVRIVLQHVVKDQKVDWALIRLELYEEGLDADMYIRLFQKVTSITGVVLHNIEFTNFVTLIFEHMDENYKQPGNPSKTAKAWSLYENTKSVYNAASSEWTRRDGTQEFWKAVDASHGAHVELHKWWSAIGTDVPAENHHTNHVFENLKRSVHHVWHEVHAKTQQSTAFKLRTPKKTGIKTCEERGSPVWCTNCDIADNVIENAIEQGSAIGTFYSQQFPKIINDVNLYFNQLGEYNADFFESKFGPLSSTKIPKNKVRWQVYVANDWSQLWDNFAGYVLDLGNDTKKDAWIQNVDSFLSASRLFVTSSTDKYVPFYGYGIQHMYEHVLFTKCNLPEAIFVQTGTSASRIDYIDNALIACAILILVIITNTTWSVIPLIWIANTVVIGALVSFLYLYMVYGYQLNCAPLLPYTLIEDINAWYHARIQPGCFYKSLPNMALNVTEDRCLTCSGPQRYINCGEYTNVNHNEDMLALRDLISEYHIFWPLLFYIRWQWPTVAVFLVRYGVLSFDSILGQLAMSAWQGQPIDPMWIDCYHAMWLDNIVAGAIIVFGAYASTKLAIIAIQTSIKAAFLTWNTYTTLGYMSLTVEQSVVIE